MHKIKLLAAAAIAATATLSACNTEPETVQINKYDPMAEALRNAKQVAPPPMIQVSRTYRCRDNSLYFVDFYTNHTATLRRTQDGIPDAALTAEGGNPPYAGSDYSVSGTGTTVTIVAPGHGSQTCHT